MKSAHCSLITALYLISATLCLLISPVFAADQPPEGSELPAWNILSLDSTNMTPEEWQVIATNNTDGEITIEGIGTGDTEISDDIKCLARSLENNPLRIFEYVRNQIEYFPSFGSRQGATALALSRSGNDLDQASLLIALLKTADTNSDAHYAGGSVVYTTAFLASLLGVPQAKVLVALQSRGIPVAAYGSNFKVTHYWVEATVNGINCVLDPSFVESEMLSGVNLSGWMGYDRSNFVAHALSGAVVTSNSIQKVNETNIRADLVGLSSNLISMLVQSNLNSTVEEVLGGVRKIPLTYTSLPTNLTYAQQIVSGTKTNYSSLPSTFYATLKIQHSGINQTFKAHEITGKRVTIFYTGTGNAPQLMVDGQCVATGTATTVGTLYTLTLTVSVPPFGSSDVQSWPMSLKSGSKYAVACDFGGTSALLIKKLGTQLAVNRQSGLSDTSEPVLGGTLNLIGLYYMHQLNCQTRVSTRVLDVFGYRKYLAGVVRQEDGYGVDMPLSLAAGCYLSGTADDYYAWGRGDAVANSAFEHGVLEQTQGSGKSAASSVKIVQLENFRSNTTYYTTSATWSTIQANLSGYSASDLSIISQYLNGGYSAILPKYGNALSGDWRGSGFFAYTISQVAAIIGGGYSGGASGGTGSVQPGIVQNLVSRVEFSEFSAGRQPVFGADPVDLFTGDLVHQRDDLVIGQPGLCGLTFSRTYNSGLNSQASVMGYGWKHNFDVRATVNSHGAPGLGSRAPLDLVSAVVRAKVCADVMKNENNLKGWMISALVGKWELDQLTDNSVSVQLADRALEFIKLSDGSYNPPPGVTATLHNQNGSFVMEERFGKTYTFNTNGMLSSWSDADSNSVYYSYNSATNLVAVSNSFGRALSFTYTNGFIGKVSDNAGRSVSYTYSGSNLVSVLDSGSNSWSYNYGSNHLLTSIRDPLAQLVVSNSFNALGKIEAQWNGKTNVWNFYVSGCRGVEENPQGAKTIQYFDDEGRNLGAENALGHREWNFYDGQGHLITNIDARGYSSAFRYDSHHNLIRRIDAMTNETAFVYDDRFCLVAVTNTLRQVNRYDYDNRFHVISQVDAMGYTNRFSYTQKGLLYTSVRDVRAITNSFDSYGNITSIQNPNGGVIVNQYNSWGDLTMVINELGKTNIMAYDKRRLLEAVRDPQGGTVSNVFNAAGLLVSSEDQRGQVTVNTYSPTLKITSCIAPDGGTISNIYDSADRIIAIINLRGGVISNTWDTAGRLIAKRDPNGVTVRMTYDNAGNVLAVTDGLGNITTNIYDALNRLQETRSPNGAVARIEYDAASRVTGTVDSLSRRTEFTLDALGRKVAVKRPDNKTEHYVFDGFGNLLAFTNAAGNAQCFIYDSMDRKTGESNAVGTVRYYGFDAAGNLTSKTDGNGRQTLFDYNALNRLVRTTYADNSVVTFTNDPAGNLIGMTDPWGTASSVGSYDNAGRLSAWTDHYNSTVQYRYDKAGGITNISYPDNNAVTYGWDTAGRLISVKDWADRTWDFSYDGANRLSGIQYPNGVNYTRGYNADGQLTNYVYSKGGTPFISRAFERNTAGLKTCEVISAGLEVEPPDTWQKHTSDKADRLTSMSRRDEYVVPERWRGYTPSYNQEGQVTNINEGYRSWASGNDLTWDSAGRLVEYAGLRQTNLWTDMPPMPSWGLEIGYDGLGARTVRTDELLTRRQVVDRVGRLRLPLMETDQNNTPTRYYVWAPGIGLLAQIEADTTIHYVHADENGSTLAMTDSNGNVTDQFAYSPWGELLGRTGTNTTAFTFVGGGGVYWEGGSLYRMGARYYDARLKRWLSADPAGMAGGANLYLYASANPLFWVDLLGLCGETYFENPGISWDEQQDSVVLRATLQEQLGRIAELRTILKENPGAEWNMTDSSSLREAVSINRTEAYFSGVGTPGALRMVGSSANIARALPSDEAPYQLKLFPDEAYNRSGHYGRTPTPQQRASVPVGMEFDHNPTLVNHYYEGVNGSLPGYNLTQAERIQHAQSLSAGAAATPAAQRAQGAAAAAYSKQQKLLWGME